MLIAMNICFCLRKNTILCKKWAFIAFKHLFSLDLPLGFFINSECTRKHGIPHPGFLV